MPQEVWTAVDDFVTSLSPVDSVLEAIVTETERAGLPAISVSPAQGQLLAVLVRSIGAESILEIGTLGGYSAVCLARALPNDGRMVTLDVDAMHATVARRNIAAAGLTDRVTVVVGPALDTLSSVHSDHPGGFDLIFIDADKEAYPEYWSWSLTLSHPGTLIIADNVVREGAVADADSHDPRVQGVRRLLELAAAEPRVSTGVVQTVGAKGYDGFSVSVLLPGAQP